ncbi:nitroreductase/quinone reductase family protein [Geodermatophilus sp. SYSU D00691]
MALRNALTNRVANPVLRPLLRSRVAGRRLGRHLAVIRYTGARTGEPHELVAGYARAGDVVWIWVGGAEVKRWWRNFRSPREVELWLAGEHVAARAVAVEGAQEPERCRAGVVAYTAGIPGGARAMRLRGEPAELPDQALRGMVLVRAEPRS